MKTLTVRLPDELARGIEQESIARRVSKSVVVRERLANGDAAEQTSTGLGEILAESWAAKTPTRHPEFGSRKKQQLAEIIRAKKLHR